MATNSPTKPGTVQQVQYAWFCYEHLPPEIRKVLQELPININPIPIFNYYQKHAKYGVQFTIDLINKAVELKLNG